MADRPPRPEPHLGHPFRGGCSLVEHWLFGLGFSPGRLVRLLCRETPPHGKPDPGGRTGRARCWVLRERPLVGSTSAGSVCQSLVAVAGRDRPYFENCTVDASIICSCQVSKGTR
jgi:hypothetical protein